MVRGTISSGERREHKRAAGCYEEGKGPHGEGSGRDFL